MFLKPANSDMKITLKKSEMSPEKKPYTAETGNWKRHFSKDISITMPLRWITSL